MSKSKKNVIDPTSIIKMYGADTARWFMLSDSPPDRDLEWTDNGIAGSFKFINKIWSLSHNIINNNYDFVLTTNKDNLIYEKLDETIIRVTENIDLFQYNKAVANIYELINLLQKLINSKTISKTSCVKTIEIVSLLIQPFVPHLSEEIWFLLGGKGLAIAQKWPSKLNISKKNNFIVAIQVKGKTKDVISLKYTPTEKEFLEMLKKNIKIKKIIMNKEITRSIYVPNKIINILIK